MQHLDFHRRRPPAPGWALALCAVAALACLLLALDLWGGWRLRAEQAQEVQRVQAAIARRLRPAGAAAPVASRASVNASRSGEAALRARALWQASLARPWRALFQVLEQHAAPRVPVQQLSVDARFETAQLQVEARNLAELFAYVQALHTAGGPLRSAQLLGHEWVAEGAAAGPVAGEGGQRLRARIVLKLVAPAPVPVPAWASSNDNTRPARSVSARTGV